MKTFEERYTAWIDGKLTGPELAAFEKLLEEEHPGAKAEKEVSLKLGALLRSHGPAPVLKNADFFNHQLLTRISADETEAARTEPLRGPVSRWILQPFPWVAVCAMVLSGYLFYRAAVPPPDHGLGNFMPTPAEAQETPHFAEIVSAESTDPDISVTPIHSDEGKVTVLWVDGLNYLPANFHVE